MIEFIKKIRPGVRIVILLNITLFLLFRFTDLQQYQSNFYLHYVHSSSFNWYQPFTYMFMHTGWMHLLINMGLLYSFGNVIESLITRNKFIIYYIAAGLFGAILHTDYLGACLYVGLRDLTPAQIVSAGSSSICYALISSFATIFPYSKIYLFFYYPVQSRYLICILIIVEFMLLIINLKFDYIDHAAHIGGIIAGILFSSRIKYYSY